MRVSFEHLKLPVRLDFGLHSFVQVRSDGDKRFTVSLELIARPSDESIEKAYDNAWGLLGNVEGGGYRFERSFTDPDKLPSLLETFFDKSRVEDAIRAVMPPPEIGPSGTPSHLIFIDIDGVLLSFRSWTTAHNAPLWRLPVESRMKHLELDQTSIGLLVRLCDRAHAKLVLTSTWRKTWPHDLEALHGRLIEQGLRRDLWHTEWMLPVIPDSTKWQELARWGSWSTNTVALIIDDDLPPEDAPPALAEQAAILQADKFEGFGAYNYFDSLDFFGVEDGAVKPPKGQPPERGVRPYPTMQSARLRPAPSMYRT